MPHADRGTARLVLCRIRVACDPLCRLLKTSRLLCRRLVSPRAALFLHCNHHASTLQGNEDVFSLLGTVLDQVVGQFPSNSMHESHQSTERSCAATTIAGQ
jgi:hypothetical protein